eukprot:scaffold600_cov385-Prasinococcus_capsulatus_cf.AAC.8
MVMTIGPSAREPRPHGSWWERGTVLARPARDERYMYCTCSACDAMPCHAMYTWAPLIRARSAPL